MEGGYYTGNAAKCYPSWLSAALLFDAGMHLMDFRWFEQICW